MLKMEAFKDDSIFHLKTKYNETFLSQLTRYHLNIIGDIICQEYGDEFKKEIAYKINNSFRHCSLEFVGICQRIHEDLVVKRDHLSTKFESLYSMSDRLEVILRHPEYIHLSTNLSDVNYLAMKIIIKESFAKKENSISQWRLSIKLQNPINDESDLSLEGFSIEDCKDIDEIIIKLQDEYKEMAQKSEHDDNLDDLKNIGGYECLTERQRQNVKYVFSKALSEGLDKTECLEIITQEVSKIYKLHEFKMMIRQALE